MLRKFLTAVVLNYVKLLSDIYQYDSQHSSTTIFDQLGYMILTYFLILSYS